MREKQDSNEKMPSSSQCPADQKQESPQQKETSEDVPLKILRVLTKETPTKRDEPITQEEIDALLKEKNHKE